MCSVAVASVVLPFLPMLPKQILLTNFITDFPYLAIASDNVDEDQLNQPGKWNMKIIRNYMIVFGLHSSLFDIVTFMVLLKVFHMQPSGFQTGWFVESILSELFILFIIRTHKNFFKSKPASLLSWLSLLGFVLTIALPYSPLAAEVGLVPLPLMALMSMVAIVFAYVLTADVLKVWFFRRLENR
jgi:Mg2+-importing ATPase